MAKLIACVMLLDMMINLNDAAIEYMRELGFKDIVLLTDSSKT